jgi:polar amino acid transport system substrate-binding protein
MKARHYIVIAILFSILGPLSVSADQLTIVGDTWCPYNCEPGTTGSGYMIEIAQQVFGKAGHTVVYRKVEWKKAIEETRRGAYTAIVGSAKDDAPDFVFPEKCLGKSHTSFFVKKGSTWRYSGTDSLKKIRLGIAEGYSYNNEVDKYIAANKGKPCISAATGDVPIQVNIDKLMKGEIDAFIEDPSVYGSYCGARNLYKVLGAIQVAGESGKAEKVYIAFSPANRKAKEYAAVLSAGIEQLRKTGELKRLLDKYYVKDWE